MFKQSLQVNLEKSNTVMWQTNVKCTTNLLLLIFFLILLHNIFFFNFIFTAARNTSNCLCCMLCFSRFRRFFCFSIIFNYRVFFLIFWGVWLCLFSLLRWQKKYYKQSSLLCCSVCIVFLDANISFTAIMNQRILTGIMSLTAFSFTNRFFSFLRCNRKKNDVLQVTVKVKSKTNIQNDVKPNNCAKTDQFLSLVPLRSLLTFFLFFYQFFCMSIGLLGKKIMSQVFN